MRAGDLRVEARQLVEIARALSYGARFIILDEPTAQLDGEEIKRLFVRMRELQAAGRHLPVHLAPPAGGLRDLPGRHRAARRPPHRHRPGRRACRRTSLIEAMTGENVHLRLRRRGGPDRRRRRGRGARGRRPRRRRLPRRQLRVRRGEVVGISGATSSGRIGVAEAVAGLGRLHRRHDPDRRPALPFGDVPAALALGVGCVPKSRHAQGLVLSQSVADNTTMTITAGSGALGFIAPRPQARLDRADDPRSSASSPRGRTSSSPASPAATSRRWSWAARWRTIPRFWC